MISVIIPVLNESTTVASVVALARRDPDVSEVIVVDDGSIDGSAELAHLAGARVLTSTLLGKGASLEDGMRAARNELLVFLDGDLTTLEPDIIKRLVEPLRTGNADFVKARFTRAAGRVTLLTARPLLRQLFPELASLEQPLGGIVAARRSLLRDLRFENDYGVDVGLLIDAALSGARIAEVDIGYIDHDSQPLGDLGEMAHQVTRAILARAAQHGRLKANFLDDIQEIERHNQADLDVIVQRLPRPERLALFDMDGVLLRGRFVVEMAHRLGKGAALDRYLDNDDYTPEERTRRIAGLFTGVPREMFEEIARDLPLMPGAKETVVALRREGYRVGVVTDSYFAVSEVVRRRVFADFSVAHLMRFHRGKATGQVSLSAAMRHPSGCLEHEHCKYNVMLHLMDKLDLEPEQILAVGDGENDVCMLRAAGQSVAYRTTKCKVRAAAQYWVDGALTDLLAAISLPLHGRFVG